MKNLVILGVPRAGKSTLAKYVVEQLTHNGVAVTLISADALIGGLTAQRNSIMWRIFVRPWRHVFPKLRVHSKQRLQNDLRRFITRFLDETASEIPIIFEGSYITPDEAIRVFNPDKFKIVVVGYPNADTDEKLHDIKKFDKNSPLSRIDKQHAIQRIRGQIQTSKKYQQQSGRNFVFLDTSTDYHRVLRDFAENISDFLKD